MHRLPLAATLLSLTLLAGCMDGGESAVILAGAGPDERSEGTATCEEDGTLKGQVRTTAGTLHVRILDGDGRAVLDKPFSDGALDLRLEGEPGTWRLDLRSSPDYDGRYDVTFRCGSLGGGAATVTST